MCAVVGWRIASHVRMSRSTVRLVGAAMGLAFVAALTTIFYAASELGSAAPTTWGESQDTRFDALRVRVGGSSRAALPLQPDERLDGDGDAATSGVSPALLAAFRASEPKRAEDYTSELRRGFEEELASESLASFAGCSLTTLLHLPTHDTFEESMHALAAAAAVAHAVGATVVTLPRMQAWGGGGKEGNGGGVGGFDGASDVPDDAIDAIDAIPQGEFRYPAHHAA